MVIMNVYLGEVYAKDGRMYAQDTEMFAAAGKMYAKADGKKGARDTEMFAAAGKMYAKRGKQFALEGLIYRESVPAVGRNPVRFGQRNALADGAMNALGDMRGNALYGDMNALAAGVMNALVGKVNVLVDGKKNAQEKNGYVITIHAPIALLIVQEAIQIADALLVRIVTRKTIVWVKMLMIILVREILAWLI